MELVLERMSEKSSSRVSFGTVRITHLDDADIRGDDRSSFFAEALETLSEEAEPLGLRVFWIKSKV